LTNGGALVAQPTIYTFKSALDAGGVTIPNSPISFSFSNPSTSQSWANGYFNVSVVGNGTSDQIAAFTQMRGNGSGQATGYKGYATSDSSSHVGGMVGVQGYVGNGGSTGATYGIAFDGIVATVGGNLISKDKLMAVRANSNVLIRGGSIWVVSSSTVETPKDFSGNTGHLITSGVGQLYVQGKTEFDDEVFFDANESSSFTAVTGTYTAGSRTIILANGTFSVFLPAVSGISGRKYTIKNTGVGTITVDGNASETIDGNATQTLTANTVTRLICDGTTWWVI